MYNPLHQAPIREGRIRHDMRDDDKTRQQLVDQLRELRQRVATLEGVECQRRQTEKELRASEARYRALAESTPDIIYILSRQGRLLYANQAASQCIGRPVATTSWASSSPICFRRKWPRPTRKKSSGSSPPARSWKKTEMFHFGPQEVWLRIHLLPLREESGQTTSVMGVCHNITDRKRAEEAVQQAEVTERRQAEEALRQSERRFRNYFQQGLIGMSVTSVDKRWLEVNDRLCEMLGYCREELLRTTWEAVTHPDDIEENRQMFQTLLAGEIEHFTLNKRFLHKGGSVVHTAIHTRAFRRNDGTVNHIVTLIEDITARKQAEEALVRQYRTLRHLLQSSDHERQLIAYEIHDGLAQQLAAAIMQFQVFKHLKDSSPKEAAKAFEAATTMLQQGHFETRRLITGVGPASRSSMNRASWKPSPTW